MRPWILLALPVAALGAPPAMPRNAECRRALDALEAAEDHAASQPEGSAARAREVKALPPLRRRAAQSCLGGTGEPSPPEHIAPPAPTPLPMVVAPPAPKLATPAPPPIAPMPAPPAMITSCDLTGCWASDGSRLNRVGGALVTPQVQCMAQGQVVRCR